MTALDERFPWRGGEVRWTRLGSGPDVVLCHGTPWSAQLWVPIAEALSSTFTVHLWDMPGFGTSRTGPDQDVSLAAQGEVFRALLGHWDLAGPPHVVAHDVGGAVALRAHLLGGARYASLALVDVVALAPWGSEFFRLVAAHAEVFARLPAHLHEALVRAYVAGAAHRPLPATTHDALVEPWLGPSGQEAFYRQIAQADQRDTDEFGSRLGELDLPVLIAWGTEDAWIPVDRAHRLAATVPDARLRLISGAGHLVQLDAPEALTATLLGWLASLHPTRRGA